MNCGAKFGKKLCQFSMVAKEGTILLSIRKKDLQLATILISLYSSDSNKIKSILFISIPYKKEDCLIAIKSNLIDCNVFIHGCTDKNCLLELLCMVCWCKRVLMQMTNCKIMFLKSNIFCLIHLCTWLVHSISMYQMYFRNYRLLLQSLFYGCI